MSAQTSTSAAPRWWILAAGGAVALAAATGFLPGSDWADGASRAGLAALLAAAVLLVAGIVWRRRGSQPRTVGQRPPGRLRRNLHGLAIVVLVVVFLTSLNIQTPLHDSQASQLLRQGQFGQAVREYGLAGDTAGQADTYLAWARQLAVRGQYSRALDTVGQVTGSDQNAGDLRRAYALEADVYDAWGRQVEAQGDFATACGYLEQGRQVAQGSAQTNQIRGDLAQCYLAMGQRSLSQGDYYAALTSLNQALANAQTPDQITQVNVALDQTYLARGQHEQALRDYASAAGSFEQAFSYATAAYGPSSAQARQAAEAAGVDGLAAATLDTSSHDYQTAVDILYGLLAFQNGTMIPLWDKTLRPRMHRLAATAYYGLGHQQLAGGDCTGATSSFHTILQQYRDTPEAAATSSLALQPHSVVGQIVNGGTPAPNVHLFLSATWQLSLQGLFYVGEQAIRVGTGEVSASDDYSTYSDASGSFTFPNLPPGSTVYAISYVENNGGVEEVMNVDVNANGPDEPADAFHVQPFCNAELQVYFLLG